MKSTSSSPSFSTQTDNTVTDLKGKTIVVAGAAGRIGQEITRGALAAGANVIAADHNVEAARALQSELSNSGAIRAVEIDIRDVTSITDVFSLAEQAFGGVSGAVNTAYPRNSRYGAAFPDVTFEDFSDNLSLHLGGYFIFMQQCALYARNQEREFSLVNLSSIYGSVAPRFDVYEGTQMTMPVEYAAIKSSIEHLTRYVNAYMKGTAFRANCISPGGILAGQDPNFLERYGRYTMRKGMLDAGDVVGAVLFALSDASRYMIGQNITVDDGFSL